MPQLLPLYFALLAAVIISDVLYFGVKLAALGIKNYLDKKSAAKATAQPRTLP